MTQETIAEPLFDDAAMFLMAAHELKSPLALIRQLALSLESGDMSQRDISTLVRQIRLTSERALRLTSDVTRSARNDTLFDLEPLNPVSVCEEVAHELAPLFTARHKKIEVTTRARPPLLVANRDLLKRVLLNFGDNALHYALTNEPVRMNVHTIGEQVRIGVRDYGPALPMDVWSRLSERIDGQAMQPIGSRPNSSGLGLFIAGQFAEMMNGAIGATRHRDGVTFYVDMAASRQLSLI